MGALARRRRRQLFGYITLIFSVQRQQFMFSYKNDVNCFGDAPGSALVWLHSSLRMLVTLSLIARGKLAPTTYWLIELPECFASIKHLQTLRWLINSQQ